MARCRVACGIILIVASTPFFLKMPAFSARDNGAKPVQPLMPIETFGRSCAIEGAAIAAIITTSSFFIVLILLSPGTDRLSDRIYHRDPGSGNVTARPERTLPLHECTVYTLSAS